MTWDQYNINQVFLPKIDRASDVLLTNVAAGEVLVRSAGGIWINSRVKATTPEYDDIPIGIERLMLGASNPSDGFIDAPDNIVKVKLFSAVVMNQFWINEEMTHAWKEGTPISLHLHLHPSTAAAGVSKWFAQVKIAESVSGAFSAIIDRSMTATHNGLNTDIVAFPDIDMTGYTISCLIHAKIWRDPTDPDDTYGADVGVLRAGIHIQRDTWGSTQLYVK